MKTNWKRTFAVIYAGQAFSLVGSAAVQFAIIWWITVQTGSALALTMAAIVGFIPNMAVGPFAGVWVDRVNRRTVMMAADLLVALSSAALAIAFMAYGELPIWLVYVILFLRGLGSTFHSPAMQAAIPTLVPTNMLTRAGGWGNMVSSMSNMIGPVLGALLMENLTLGAVMLVDVVGAALAVGSLLFIRIPDIPASAERPTVLGDLKAGFAAMRSNRPLRAVFGPMMLCNIIFMPLGSIYPLLVRDHFGGGAIENGISEFVFAGGLLASSFLIGIWGGMKRRFLMASLALAVLGLTSTISGALPPSGFWPFVACCFFMGSSGTFINVPMMAYTQETIPAEVLGKVLSLMMTAMTLAMPIGLMLAGPACEYLGVDRYFFWSGLAMLVTALICYFNTRAYDKVPEAE